jgi:hypothetical protein
VSKMNTIYCYTVLHHSQPSSHPEPAQSLDRLQSEAAAGKILQADLAGERSNPCKLQGLD